MGLKIPQDEDYLLRGNNCNACTPVPYAIGEQPKFVWVIFYDVVSAPALPDAPNNMLFKCEQSPVDACTYNGYIGSDTHYWHCQYSMFNSQVTLYQHVPGQAFGLFEDWGPPCGLTFPENEFTIPPEFGHSGRAVVGLIEDMLIPSLTSDYHFVPRDRTYYERQDVGMDHVLVRLACRKFSSNLLIYIDYEDLELLPFPM